MPSRTLRPIRMPSLAEDLDAVLVPPADPPPKSPSKPSRYVKTMNLRILPDLRDRLKAAAAAKGVSFNTLCSWCLEEGLRHAE